MTSRESCTGRSSCSGDPAKVAGALAGSVSQHLIRHAPCPVAEVTGKDVEVMHGWRDGRASWVTAVTLVVVDSQGRAAFTGMLLGSVSQRVLHYAQWPVAVVR